MSLFDLRPAADCRFDAVALGEVMLRFDPGEDRVRSARSFRVWEGGGEYNVARGLARTFGLRTAVVTALPRNDLGLLCEGMILQGGVNTEWVTWADADAIGRDVRMGLNFTERGFGPRGARGLSDRARSAAAQLGPDAIDWDELFGDRGVRWFHTGGIFASLSSATAQTTLTAIRAARRHGVVVSFDLNPRPSLWSSHADPEQARRRHLEIIGQVDVLIGDEYAFADCLDLEPAPPRNDPCDPEPFLSAAQRMSHQFQNIGLFAATLRDPLTASENRWGAAAWSLSETAVTPPSTVAVLDRVGGGDAFAAGLIWGLMHGENLTTSLGLGVAHGALAMTTPGDNAVASLPEVWACAQGRGAGALR